MPRLSVTMADRLGAIGSAAIIALMVFGIASLLYYAISKNDCRKKIQGKPVRWWVTMMYMAGATLGACLADNQQYRMHEIVGGMGGFGLLAGLAIGNVHGAIDLFRQPRTLTEPPEKRPSVEMDARLNKLQNPYTPPRVP